MSKPQDAVYAYLHIVSQHRDVIAHAYANRNVVTTNQNNEKSIRVLLENRALVPYRKDQYRLSASLTRHLDEVFQRQQMYAVGANLGELVKRLPLLVDEYTKAYFDNREDDAERYEDDYAQGVFELRENIEQDLLRLRTLTDTQFGNVSTTAEKIRQNQFYIGRAKLLGTALATLAHHEPFLEMEDSVHTRSLFDVYQDLILANMKNWRALLMDVDHTLHAYLYKLRSVSLRAQRLRKFAAFLQKNPHYNGPDQEDLTTLPDWAGRYSGSDIRTYPRLTDSYTRDALAELASTITSTAVKPVREQKIGTLIAEDEPAPVVLNIKLAQRANQQYFKLARESVTPVSAVEWKTIHEDFATLHTEAWLQYLLHGLQIGAAQNCQYLLIEKPVGFTLSGNVIVEDVHTWKKL